jgi:hypothetical protein
VVCPPFKKQGAELAHRDWLKTILQGSTRVDRAGSIVPIELCLALEQRQVIGMLLLLVTIMGGYALFIILILQVGKCNGWLWTSETSGARRLKGAITSP